MLLALVLKKLLSKSSSIFALELEAFKSQSVHWVTEIKIIKGLENQSFFWKRLQFFWVETLLSIQRLSTLEIFLSKKFLKIFIFPPGTGSMDRHIF